MKKENNEIFMLTPVIFNSPFVKEELTDAFTITISITDMKKLETNEALEDFLMYNYNELYFIREADKSAIRYGFYFNKLAEERMKEA